VKRRVHYVLSTHWDREWYQTFQDFRYRLVRLLDRVIAGWEDGRLKGPLQTDGQAIILEDYLEIRPERRALVERLVREGRFVVGPWYVLPDEFCVSGESLIRNLRLGGEVARSFGAEPSAAGFVCDIFGHTSQMPQILAGFGIRGGFLWRGTNTDGKRNVLWKGADGTVLPCLRFGPIGYCDFALRVRGAPNRSSCESEPAGFLERLESYLKDEAQLTDVDPILAFDGCDHQEWDEGMYAVLLERMARTDGDSDIVHSSLDDYLVEMLSQQDRITTTLQGELREPGRDPAAVDQQWLIPGVLSSRINLKQANSRCQTLLCHWAEPFSAFASDSLGAACPYPGGYLNVAWRWLIQNHPHDSIDGCSIDQVHKDMEYRFDQSHMISQRLTTEATHHIGANIEGELTDHDLRVVVYNPLPRQMDRVVELDLQISPHWPTFNEYFPGFEPKPAFRIFDAGGNELPYQRLSQDKNRLRWRVRQCATPEGVRYHAVKVALRLSVPPLGYTTLHVCAADEGEFSRHPAIPGLATGECSMENEFLAAEIAPNGTLTLTDKRTGQLYSRLLTFENMADIGDGWSHGVAQNDQAYVSTACRAQVSLVHDNPLLTTFRVRTVMQVPSCFDFGAMRRAEDLVDLVIDSFVTLRQGQDFVEVRTIVDNVADDHRLRVLLPSGVADAQTYLADSAFDVVERPIPLRQDNYLYREPEVETKPQQSWTGVFGPERGLAVVADALLETAVRDLPERPIALTLFRATGRTVGTTGEPGGQMRGRLTFDYLLVPLDGAPDRTQLCELGQAISAGLQVAQLGRHDLPIYRVAAPPLPPRAGFLGLGGPAVLTSARQVDGALEVRLFNPLGETITATLNVSDRPAGATHPRTVQRVDLASNPLGEPWALDGETKVALKPKEIVTLRLAP
jgi:alpha-mannosidase